MGLSECAGRGDGHPGEWGLVLSLEDQRSVGYLLKPLLPSVFAQTWVEAMNGVRWDSGGDRGGREGSKCVFPKRKGFWERRTCWCGTPLAGVRKDLNVFPPFRMGTTPSRCFFPPGILGLQDWFSALLIRLFFPCTVAPSTRGDAHHSSLWNFQRPCKTHSADVFCRFHLPYVLCIINLLKGSHWTFTFVTVT